MSANAKAPRRAAAINFPFAARRPSAACRGAYVSRRLFSNPLVLEESALKVNRNDYLRTSLCMGLHLVPLFEYQPLGIVFNALAQILFFEDANGFHNGKVVYTSFSPRSSSLLR